MPRSPLVVDHDTQRPVGPTKSPKKRFAEALTLAVNRAVQDGEFKGRKRLEAIAERLVVAALNGDMDAIKEVANRLDGKPAQQVIATDNEGNSVPMGLAVMFVTPDQGKNGDDE